MDAPEIVVGLDIGTTKIACLVGRKTDHNKIEILGIGKAPSLGVTRGVVSNIEKTVQSIRSAVEEAEALGAMAGRVIKARVVARRAHDSKGVRLHRRVTEHVHSGIHDTAASEACSALGIR